MKGTARGRKPSQKAKRQRSTDSENVKLATSSPTTSRFLQLPVEIRQEIFRYITIERPAALRPRGRGNLETTERSLLSVSKQVRHEYRWSVHHFASIRAHVKNFDFGHVVKFLNKLSEHEVKELPTLNTGANNAKSRKLLVVLEITPDCPENPESLQRWLLRCDHPTKKGTQLNTLYYAQGDVGKRDGNATAGEKVLHALGKKLRQIETIELGRISEELEKIVRALKRAVHG